VFTSLADLSTKKLRKLLDVRSDPYWQRLAEGQYLGFRRGPDTWLARFRGRDGRQQYQPLGEALQFDEARRKAEEWISQIAGATVRTVKRDTVRAALETYLTYLRQQGRKTAAAAAASLFKTAVYGHAIAGRKLESLTHDDFTQWRDALKGEQRAARSINRYVRQVTAALNVAVKRGHVGSLEVWQLEPLDDDVEEGHETAEFLTPEQRAAIIAAATPAAALFFRGLQHTGARPKELAAATVKDFDGESIRLASRKGKPPKLKPRRTFLDASGLEFFRQQTAGKAASAAIFMMDDGTAWTRKEWAAAWRAAVAAHNAKGAEQLPLGLGCYSFRHSRISELLQVHGVDPITTALQCGTSTAIIERNYHRFIPQAIREKLAGVKE
jgi:integrase